MQLRYILFVFTVLVIFSCDNELELIAESKETPVVYGVVDQSDTAQYIRVERTFIDSDVTPNIIAQDPDSLYYDDITVKLVRVLNGEEYILERVDGNLEGYPREEGAFAQSPNYLYKILTSEIPLIPEELIELRIEGIFEDRAITSTSVVIEPPFLLNPAEDGVVNLEPQRALNIGWTPRANEDIFTVNFYFNITESRAGSAPVDKRLIWNVESNTSDNNLQRDGTAFYSFLLGALEKDEAITRRLNSVEFELITGSVSLADYIRVGQSNLGITSSGEIPVFSNLSEGLGIFGTTHTHFRRNISLTGGTLDSLRNGQLTRELNFE